MEEARGNLTIAISFSRPVVDERGQVLNRAPELDNLVIFEKACTLKQAESIIASYRLLNERLQINATWLGPRSL